MEQARNRRFAKRSGRKRNLHSEDISRHWKGSQGFTWSRRLRSPRLETSNFEKHAVWLSWSGRRHSSIFHVQLLKHSTVPIKLINNKMLRLPLQDKSVPPFTSHHKLEVEEKHEKRFSLEVLCHQLQAMKVSSFLENFKFLPLRSTMPNAWRL